MTAEAINAPVASGAIGRWWGAVRATIVTLSLACLALAAVLHPAAAARYLSSDGELAASSQRLLYIAVSILTLAGVLGIAIWRRWRTCTPGRERVVLGAGMLFGSVAVSALAVEAGLTAIHRLVKPLGAERHYFFEYDQVLGWKHRPGSSATFKNSLVRIDRDGFRVSGRERGPYHARVLLLGDSQAFGDGVGAEDTFAARLEDAMPGLRTLNASVIGYGTDQQLLYFERDGRLVAPDLTVVALNAYDLRDNLSTRVRSGYEKPRFIQSGEGLTLTNVPVPGDGLAGRLQRDLQRRSHLFRLLTRARRDQRQADDERLPPPQRLALEIYPDDAHVERGLAVTAAILDRLAEQARQSRIRVVVVFLPYQMDFGGDPVYAGRTDRVVQYLRDRTEKAGVTFLDIREKLAAERPDRIFLDAMHLTPEGHRQVAAMLEEIVREEKLLSRTYED